MNLSRSAIKAARTDLTEALALLRPDSAKGENGRNGQVQPVLAEGGAVDRLRTDAEALAGFWPAAFGFHSSTRNGLVGVSTTYENIVTQVESMIELLTQALRNYDNAEGAGEGAERTAQA